MRFRLMPCCKEEHGGEGPGGILLRGDIIKQKDALLARFAGTVQTIYLDPPFNTGKAFVLRQRVGDLGWQTGKPTIELPAYNDRWPDTEDFLALLREAIVLSHALLSPDGSIFLHIDPRMSAHIRFMLDDVFGSKNFVNEIIWSYSTGGRSMAHFSRKHDVILFYRKTPGAYFNIRDVGVPRAKTRSNHMRKAVDAQGRSYRSIVSQGKEYRYYDDDPVFPGDVWDDVSHLQQKDPQRTGYDNQKPIRLLERVILSTSRPGDLVCDLFGGSGTTGVTAARHDRRFLLTDCSGTAITVARKRLLGQQLCIEDSTEEGAPILRGKIRRGLGLAEVQLLSYQMEEGLLNMPLSDVEAVDQVSVGYLRDGVFHAFDNAARTKATPALPRALELPVLAGEPAIMTVDVLGRRLLHVMEAENGQ